MKSFKSNKQIKNKKLIMKKKQQKRWAIIKSENGPKIREISPKNNEKTV